MIARVTPYVGEGRRVPDMVGVLIEGEEHERAYVPKGELLDALSEVERLRAALRGIRDDGEVAEVDCNGEALE